MLRQDRIRRKRRTRPTKAFTLIELLVVIAIIALLLSILMPSLNTVKERAKRIVCMNNVRSLMMADVLYAGSHDDCFVDWWDPTQEIVGDVGVAWCANPDYLEALSTTQAESIGLSWDLSKVEERGYFLPESLRCPRSALDNDAYWMDAPEQIRTTYGGNYSDSDHGSGDDYGTVTIKMSLARRPAQKPLFLDSSDMCVYHGMADYLRYWDIYGEDYFEVVAAPAYRHDEGTNVAYADGHSEYTKKEQLFFYKPNSTSPDREKNERIWYILR